MYAATIYFHNGGQRYNAGDIKCMHEWGVRYGINFWECDGLLRYAQIVQGDRIDKVEIYPTEWVDTQAGNALADDLTGAVDAALRAGIGRHTIQATFEAVLSNLPEHYCSPTCTPGNCQRQHALEFGYADAEPEPVREPFYGGEY